MLLYDLISLMPCDMKLTITEYVNGTDDEIVLYEDTILDEISIEASEKSLKDKYVVWFYPSDRYEIMIWVREK